MAAAAIRSSGSMASLHEHTVNPTRLDIEAVGGQQQDPRLLLLYFQPLALFTSLAFFADEDVRPDKPVTAVDRLLMLA
jgi:hypothetical protein